MTTEIPGSEDGAANSTYYDTLEIPSTAGFNEIKSAYQRMARLLHPDKQSLHNNKQKNKAQNINNNEEEAFLKLQKAWECLRDPQSRKEYDLLLHKTEIGKASKSIPVSHKEWEFVEDEETGDLGYIYTCRCGEDIWIQKEEFEKADATIFFHCEGCSLIYHIGSAGKV